MIQVVNKKTFDIDKRRSNSLCVYIGRPSILGNPYSHLPSKLVEPHNQTKTREESIKRFKLYFINALSCDNPTSKELKIRSLFSEIIFNELNNNDTYLICYCSPKACHGDVIKTIAESRIKDIGDCYRKINSFVKELRYTNLGNPYYDLNDLPISKEQKKCVIEWLARQIWQISVQATDGDYIHKSCDPLTIDKDGPCIYHSYIFDIKDNTDISEIPDILIKETVDWIKKYRKAESYDRKAW
ncbi:MAG: hypothetical protein BAJALOKI3v1_50100 [Promethearchaeota archaeon]|nr:MAG: hypothetical protein BAJALOKI3v1_50100 [Candidatus Lokiarchaeota archaeon]